MNEQGASILLSAAFVALVVTAAQIADFTAPILTGSDKSMQQYESFRQHVERDGHHDLVVFGNSIARQSVNIRQLQRELEPVLGRTLTAYNFAAGGTPPTALDLLADLVYGVDNPEVCLIVLSAVMAGGESEGFNEKATLMRGSPYGVALLDPVAWRGPLQRWLLDHVVFARSRYAFREAARGEAPSERETGGYDPEFGYVRTEKHGSSAATWERVLGRMRNVRFGPKGKRAVLVELVRGIQAHGAEVFLAEGALHPRRFAALRDPEGDLAMARETIRWVAEETGSHALLLPSKLRFSESDFGDVSHLNASAAGRYTTWLSVSLAPGLRLAR